MMNRTENLKFEDTWVRSIVNGQGHTQWLCLNDVLKYLDRGELIENGRILKICKGVTRLPFKDGGRNRWAIRPFEIHYLTGTLSGENGIIAAKCDKLREWIDSLPMGTNNSIQRTMHPPSREAVIFNYQDQFPITFKTDCGTTYINATQMAKSFGKYPFVWLNLAGTQEFREAMVARGESASLESQVISTRGQNGATWIEENLAMEFARWLSPDFSAWCNSKIKELVNDGYATIQPRQREPQPPTAAVSFAVPKTFDEALQLAADQARKLRESEHKVSFYDEYVEGRDHFKSSRIADELEISVVLLHRFLAEEGIVHYERGRKRWVVNAPYRPLQCDAPYMWQNSEGKVYPFGSVKRWTQAGREYIIELWNEKNGNI
ncbi:MAG: KilA-N domain-containing protein [Rikenellaceae bacterium]